jgi:hypothetical protein
MAIGFPRTVVRWASNRDIINIPHRVDRLVGSGHCWQGFSRRGDRVYLEVLTAAAVASFSKIRFGKYSVIRYRNS